MPAAHRVCKAAELPPGGRKIVDINGRSIGVFNVGGAFHAIRNVCPHQMAPLCRGSLGGTTVPSEVGDYEWGLEGRVIRCPWHGWEFDVTTGKSVFNPHKVRVKAYEVTVEQADGRREPCSISSDADDPSVETFDVTVEGAWVVVHV